MQATFTLGEKEALTTTSSLSCFQATSMVYLFIYKQYETQLGISCTILQLLLKLVQKPQIVVYQEVEHANLFLLKCVGVKRKSHIYLNNTLKLKMHDGFNYLFEVPTSDDCNFTSWDCVVCTCCTHTYELCVGTPHSPTPQTHAIMTQCPCIFVVCTSVYAHIPSPHGMSPFPLWLPIHVMVATSPWFTIPCPPFARMVPHLLGTFPPFCHMVFWEECFTCGPFSFIDLIQSYVLPVSLES